MLKKALTSLLILLLFSSSTHSIYASLLVIEKDGQVIWQVLSEEDSTDLDIPTHSFLEIKKTAGVTPNPTSTVELSKKDGKVTLIVTSENEKRQIDVSSEDIELVKIEERPEVQKVAIGFQDGKFNIQQKGISAITDFPIKIDPSTARLTVATQSGERFLSILPYQAVQGVLRSKIISKVDNNKLDIVEHERELQYSFSGQKIFNILNFFDYSVPVTLKVSATTGETVSIEGPVWYKVIGFFLS